VELIRKPKAREPSHEPYTTSQSTSIFGQDPGEQKDKKKSCRRLMRTEKTDTPFEITRGECNGIDAKIPARTLLTRGERDSTTNMSMTGINNEKGLIHIEPGLDYCDSASS
jgi:hypothetical protein